MTFRFSFAVLVLAGLCAPAATGFGQQGAGANDTGANETVQIDARAAATPFPHFWEEMFGSGRAALALRRSYMNDLHAVKAVTDFRYVRAHAILHDELGVYNEDEHGEPFYNFTYVDQIYDGLLAEGVKPVVEISFMPKKLAFNPDALHPFWYKQNVSPPKSMKRWDDLIAAFGQHLVERYGIEEVAQWYFEVWNEPNIDFWGGIPRHGVLLRSVCAYGEGAERRESATCVWAGRRRRQRRGCRSFWHTPRRIMCRWTSFPAWI